MALIPLRAQVREEQKTVVGWLLHKVLLLVLRSPTPRTNCSSRPPMAPEGLGATARSPTVLLYAAKKAERTSCRRVSRSLRAASLWRGKKNKCITMGQDPTSSSSCHNADPSVFISTRPQIFDPVLLLNHSSQFLGYCSGGNWPDFLWGTTISVIIREGRSQAGGSLLQQLLASIPS